MLKLCIICTFLVHFGGVQKMLTALFNLVWNTQERRGVSFFVYQGKMFINIEKR